MSKEIAVYQELSQKILEEKIKPLITTEILEEHKKNPIGHHSDELETVLVFLRRWFNRTKGKYVLVCTKHDGWTGKWCIGEMSGVRGVPPKIFSDECFDSREAAEHGVFLKRLKLLGLWK